MIRLGPSNKLGIFANITLHNELSESRLKEEEDESLAFKDDAPEPPQLEDVGDSDHRSVGQSDTFDTSWTDSLPLMSCLPLRLRPLVRYRIDSALNLQVLGGKNDVCRVAERALAEAVLTHIRESRVPLNTIGDWCAIPCIGSYRALADLCATGDDSALDPGVLKSNGSVLMAFAIELPSGDVITPRALLAAARRNKKTTRAAALRHAIERPMSLPDGEQWSAEDWDGFERAQRQSDKR